MRVQPPTPRGSVGEEQDRVFGGRCGHGRTWRGARGGSTPPPAPHLRVVPADPRLRGHPPGHGLGHGDPPVGRLVEEVGAAHQHVLQGERHLGADGVHDLGPEVRVPLQDAPRPARSRRGRGPAPLRVLAVGARQVLATSAGSPASAASATARGRNASHGLVGVRRGGGGRRWGRCRSPPPAPSAPSPAGPPPAPPSPGRWSASRRRRSAARRGRARSRARARWRRRSGPPPRVAPAGGARPPRCSARPPREPRLREEPVGRVQQVAHVLLLRPHLGGRAAKSVSVVPT
jgi:hypothetical protein